MYSVTLNYLQVPRSENKSNSGYYLQSSEDETYFPGRAAQIVAYGQVEKYFSVL